MVKCSSSDSGILWTSVWLFVASVVTLRKEIYKQLDDRWGEEEQGGRVSSGRGCGKGIAETTFLGGNGISWGKINGEFGDLLHLSLIQYFFLLHTKSKPTFGSHLSLSMIPYNNSPNTSPAHPCYTLIPTLDCDAPFDFILSNSSTADIQLLPSLSCSTTSLDDYFSSLQASNHLILPVPSKSLLNSPTIFSQLISSEVIAMK